MLIFNYEQLKYTHTHTILTQEWTSAAVIFSSTQTKDFSPIPTQAEHIYCRIKATFQSTKIQKT